MKYPPYSISNIILILIIWYLVPILTIRAQEPPKNNHINLDSLKLVRAKEQLRSILPIQQIILKSQAEQITANQDTLLILKEKNSKVKVIKYVKVYKTIPVFIPESYLPIYSKLLGDTSNTFFLDTFPVIHRRRGLLNKIKHHAHN